MPYDALIHGLFKRLQEIKRSQGLFEEEFVSSQSRIDKFIDTIDSVNKRLNEMAPGKAVSQLEPKAGKPHMSQEDFAALLEKLLRGSLEGLGDKISQKILDKLQDLKGSTAETRDAKIQELRTIADAELVDLSRLFNEKVESNIEEIGVEEKETRGIDKNLERLRKIKGDKRGGETKDQGEAG